MNALAPIPADEIARDRLHSAARRYAACFLDPELYGAQATRGEDLDRAAEGYADAVIDTRAAKRTKRKR